MKDLSKISNYGETVPLLRKALASAIEADGWRRLELEQLLPFEINKSLTVAEVRWTLEVYGANVDGSVCIGTRKDGRGDMVGVDLDPASILWTLETAPEDQLTHFFVPKDDQTMLCVAAEDETDPNPETERAA